MSVVCIEVSGSGSNIKVRQVSTLAGIMGTKKKSGKRVSGTKKRKKVSGTKRKRR